MMEIVWILRRCYAASAWFCCVENFHDRRDYDEGKATTSRSLLGTLTLGWLTKIECCSPAKSLSHREWSRRNVTLLLAVRSVCSCYCRFLDNFQPFTLHFHPSKMSHRQGKSGQIKGIASGVFPPLIFPFLSLHSARLIVMIKNRQRARLFDVSCCVVRFLEISQLQRAFVTN